MSRSAVRFILALLAGPTVAGLVVAIGCMLPWQVLGVMCGHNAFFSFLLFTVAVWALLFFAYGVYVARDSLR